MRKEAFLFFAATQIVILLGFSVVQLVTLVSIVAAAIAAKAIADQRRIHPASWATLLAAVISSFLVPLVMETPFARGADFMVELELKGRRVEGQAVNWTKKRVTVLGRDGRLWDFHPDEGKNYRKTANHFTPWSASEMRSQLQAEFGKRFEITGTRHYLVVHPHGQRDAWASRFESVYRTFQSYFSTRGFKIRPPRYPLVALIFHDQREFQLHAARTGVRVDSTILGYYSPETNRVLLFDMANQGGEAAWERNKENIIHETVHQAAFNTGVHSRIDMPPRWVVEGLGTMFEAPGVWGSKRRVELEDRINQGRHRDFQAILPRRPPGALATFLSSERAFKSNSPTAYAEAWALTFFLSETRPREYARYMALVGSGRGGADATSGERLKTFTKVFGDDLRMLEAQYLRYYRDLANQSASTGLVDR